MAKPKPLPKQIEESAKAAPQQFKEEVSWRETISTGSLLLDLAISGGRTRYGGLPGGIVVEISGPPGSGKTTLLAETVGSAQRAGGEARIKDPEARLDPDYCRLMGVRFDPEQYSQPDTVTDVIEKIIGPLETKGNKTQRNWDKAWNPDPAHINVEGVDSLAALSTRMEMEQGDKMGQRRAKEFSEGLRVIARHIKQKNILLLCTNQTRTDSDTPGGMAIKFYASVRVKLSFKDKIKSGDHVVGKLFEAWVAKNSLDIEWRTAPIRLIFGYGIDDLGANLQWLKDQGAFVHPTDPAKKVGYVLGDKNFQGLQAAISYAEEQNLEPAIREQVVALWHRLETEARPKRKEKVRG